MIGILFLSMNERYATKDILQKDKSKTKQLVLLCEV